MSGNRIKFEFTRALVRARKDWGTRDRCGNYVTAALAVHNYSSGDGTHSYASAERISKDTGISKRTAERALTFLRDEGLIRLDRRGGRSGDGSTWASEYSLRIPDGWSDAAESKNISLKSRSAKGTHQNDTTEPQLATSPCQPAAYVAGHQIRYITPDSSDPNTTIPSLNTFGQSGGAADKPMASKTAGSVGVLPRGNVPEPDWDAMAMAVANLPEPPW